MTEIFEKMRTIEPSLADAAGLLSIPDTFGLFMDIAAEHADILGIGFKELSRRGLFWLTVKTKVMITARPRLGDTVTVRTWPEEAKKLRCNRSYELLKDGEVIIRGKTEWAVLNTADSTLVPIEEVYPKDLTFPRGTACPEPFARIPEQFSDLEPYGEYRVRSTDIDVFHHMNNVAYVRALAGSFTTAEWEKAPKSSLDILFRAPCYEGDALAFRRREAEDGLYIRISGGENTLILAKMA